MNLRYLIFLAFIVIGFSSGCSATMPASKGWVELQIREELRSERRYREELARMQTEQMKDVRTHFAQIEGQLEEAIARVARGSREDDRRILAELRDLSERVAGLQERSLASEGKAEALWRDFLKALERYEKTRPFKRIIY